MNEVQAQFRLVPWFSARLILPPKGPFLIFTNWAWECEVATGIQWVEIRDPANCPVVLGRPTLTAQSEAGKPACWSFTS